jgi:hypothetical protein
MLLNSKASSVSSWGIHPDQQADSLADELFFAKFKTSCFARQQNPAAEDSAKLAQQLGIRSPASDNG